MPPFKNDTALPADFDGVFRFTNASDRELRCRWNNNEYIFPPMSTSPLIVPNATPEEVQHIRKKFAKEYAEREFYLSGKFKSLDEVAPAGSGKVPSIYSETDLAPYIQQCLEPLPAGRATVTALPKDNANNYRKDENGENVTKPLDKNTRLVANAGDVITS